MGRNYRFVCGEGEEPRIQALAEQLRTRLDQLSRDMGKSADERLLVMAALMLTDDLFEARGATFDGQQFTLPPQREPETGGRRKNSAA